MKGQGRLYKRGEVWWIEYWRRGRQYRESSGGTKEADARRLLKRRLGEIQGNRFVGPEEERVLVAELLDALEADYRINGRRSLDTLRWRLKPLRATFGLDRALDVNENRIERYKAARLAEKMAPATVNRELAALKRAFRLALRQKRLSTMPTITLLAEHNARQGFAEPATVAGIVRHLPPHLKNLARFAYLCGWRKGELETLDWSDVDRTNRRLVLRREYSKNEEPRVLPLTGELWEIIEEQWTAREYRRPDGAVAISRYVFHHDGRQISNFRRAWRTACKAAGVPGLLFHDLRRSAVRNLDRAGVSQAVAMKITGHKTPSVYRRYRIVNEADMREALARAEACVKQDSSRTVLPMRDAMEAAGPRGVPAQFPHSSEGRHQ